ncbi:ABC transporter permease [Halobium salinum]|uniref:ABC transporter permease n=1 Tax=Halobium salinum TaxID=1364940 RepID=A0ABD5PBL7_9EURY|nr:ABC transporter permease [Halobium salinum]
MGTGEARGGETRSVAAGWLGRSSLVLAVLTLHAVAFAVAWLLDATTWYAVFALASAAALGYVASDGPFGAAAAALGAVLLVAVGLPLATFVARQEPSVVAEKALDPEVHRMLYLTVYAPLLAALVTLVFGTPLAYLLSRGFAGDSLVQSLVDLPLVVPHSVAGLLILFGFGQGAAFEFLPVLGTVPGMVLALTFVSAPFAVNVVREGFDAVDRRLEYAARIHGASRWETFRRVDLPLVKRAMLTGGVMAWARSVSEFGAVAVVAYNVEFFYPVAGETVTGQHAPVFIFNTYTSGSLPESSAVGFILLTMSVAIFLLVRWVAGDTSVGVGS